MSGANPLPRVGEVFFDARGEDRALRLSWHPDAQVMVISVWNGETCTGTFRLPARDIHVFIESLSQGLPPVQPRGRRHASPDGAPAHQAPPQHVPAPEEAPGTTTQAIEALTRLASPQPTQPTFPMTGEYRTSQ